MLCRRSCYKDINLIRDLRETKITFVNRYLVTAGLNVHQELLSQIKKTGRTFFLTFYNSVSLFSSQKIVSVAHCSRINCYPNFFAQDFFTFSDSYIMGTIKICKNFFILKVNFEKFQNLCKNFHSHLFQLDFWKKI